MRSPGLGVAYMGGLQRFEVWVPLKGGIGLREGFI